MTDERQEKASPETEDEFKFPNLDGSIKTAQLAHLVAHMTGTKIVVDFGDGPVDIDPDPELYEPIMTGDMEYDMRYFADYEKKTAREYARRMNGSTTEQLAGQQPQTQQPQTQERQTQQAKTNSVR